MSLRSDSFNCPRCTGRRTMRVAAETPLGGPALRCNSCGHMIKVDNATLTPFYSETFASMKIRLTRVRLDNSLDHIRRQFERTAARHK